MRGKILTALFLFCMCSWSTASALVRINEVAWMGSTVSSTNEWIELANDGTSAVDLSGWHIIADGGVPNILLKGSIAPEGYFLIERTDDTTVPNIVADLIASFGSGLSNEGETLRLNNASGATMDIVIGGTNWKNIGGNNTTKETAQRTQSGWVTALATPREKNTATKSEVLLVGTSTTASEPTIVPKKNITVFAGDDVATFVDLPVEFSGRALGLSDETLLGGTYRWNFGDGETALGIRVTHVYHFAGEYTVTLDVVLGGYENTDRALVTASNLPVVISRVVVGDKGFVELINHGNKELDLSLWKLAATGGNNAFVIPLHTTILPGKTLVLPNSVTKQEVGQGGLILLSPNGTIMNKWNVSQLLSTQKETNSPLKTVTRSKLPPVQSDINSATTGEKILWGGNKEVDEPSNNKRWLIALGVGLLSVFGGVLVFREKPEQESSALDYRIIEDIIESDE